MWMDKIKTDQQKDEKDNKQAKTKTWGICLLVHNNKYSLVEVEKSKKNKNKKTSSASQKHKYKVENWQ